ncbi:DUF2894 domain-containing protein [Ramlibacter humi]|uniref:DUF2894 domain-containing protein n=1 Tax=Ramlibacter humi TaxID=2530451 RepID=UPI00142FB6C0|nr:DUF2894 domain-containing protein [Ramlibacter humi]
MSKPLPDQLAAWRDGGEWRADPVRFRFMESLADRMADQPEPVRALLERKLQAAMEAFAGAAAQPKTPPAAPASSNQHEVLAELNAYLRSVTARPAQDTGESDDPHALPSARRFRQAWESARTLERLRDALARAPANAGPLNSHALVARSLALMGELSTDYLRHFLAYAETLQWLETARDQLPREKAKAARKTRTRK